MRKLLCTGFLLGVLSLAFSAAPAANAAGSTTCTYKCSCTGAPLKCCGTTCKPTTEILCPQVITC
ncbi:MAG TPA: hypothetical protein VLB76_21730 [Thermoanaerobaculia bacterium]|jgi:hypothetical protein|nr:hypothetical protein [Thermoanaerobaculia bacterium]